MSAVCSICRREDRPAIEESHVAGISLRRIAALHPGTTAWSLRRHFQHVPVIIEQQQRLQVRQVQNDRATAKLPARVEKLIAEAEAITMTARRKRDFAGALSAIRTRLACLEMLGKISGELKPGVGGEFVLGNVSAGAVAQVNVNLPAPPTKNPEDLVRLLKHFYNLSDPPQRTM